MARPRSVALAGAITSWPLCGSGVFVPVPLPLPMIPPAQPASKRDNTAITLVHVNLTVWLPLVCSCFIFLYLKRRQCSLNRGRVFGAIQRLRKVRLLLPKCYWPAGRFRGMDRAGGRRELLLVKIIVKRSERFLVRVCVCERFALRVARWDQHRAAAITNFCFETSIARALCPN